MSAQEDTTTSGEKKGYWRNWYFAVLAGLLLQIGIYYLFTVHYS